MLLNRPLRALASSTGSFMAQRNMSSRVNLISPKDLAKLLKEDTAGKIKVADASWHMPAAKRSGFEEFKYKGRIMGSVFWDS